MTLVALTLLLYGIAHWVRPSYADGPNGRQESRFRRAMSLMLLGIEYWIAALFSSLALRPLLPAALQHPSALTMLVPGLIAMALTAVLQSPALTAHRAVPDSPRALLALTGRWASSRFCVGRR